MLSCEGIGKNIEQAINNALLELKASREDVDIKILDEGGFFKKARVLVTISEDAEEKYNKIKKAVEAEKIAENEQTQKEEEAVYTKEEDYEAPVDHIESKEKVSDKPDVEKAKDFVGGLLKTIGMNADITSEENSNEIFLIIVHPDLVGIHLKRM